MTTIEEYQKAQWEHRESLLNQFGSSGRPWAFLAIFKDFHPLQMSDPVIGKHFWRMIRERWSGFDAIPQSEFAAMQIHFADSWWPDQAWHDLPHKQTYYRGQSAQDVVGLSWTTSLEVAKGFAKGHRKIRVPEPLVLETVIDKRLLSMVVGNRNESEVVLFNLPRNTNLKLKKVKV